MFYDGYDSNYSSWDGNGIQDTPGGYAVTVQLLDAAGNVVATTTSDANGYYSFSVTLSGSFRVRFSLPEAGGGSMGNHYRFTSQNQGGDDSLDSDVDAVTGETDLFTITYGQTTALDAGVVLIYSM